MYMNDIKRLVKNEKELENPYTGSKDLIIKSIRKKTLAWNFLTIDCTKYINKQN